MHTHSLHMHSLHMHPMMHMHSLHMHPLHTHNCHSRMTVTAGKVPHLLHLDPHLIICQRVSRHMPCFIPIHYPSRLGRQRVRLHS